MTTPLDSAARQQALDLGRSFCIRAPAGSGKTGLLICRMLAALAVVEQPEQVLAITFTRKAAAEIRDRLSAALESAGTGVPPTDTYAQQVHQLALRVRQRSDARGWELATNPHRIRANTIDSLNRELARQMPVLAGLGGPLDPVDDARELYRSALQQVLQLHDDPTLDADLRSCIGRVLGLAKNRLDALLSSLIPLMAEREHWARHSADAATAQDVQAAGDAQLQRWVYQSLQRIDTLLPQAPRVEWLRCLQQLAADGRPEWDSLQGLTHWPAPEASELPHWQNLARSLLTKTGGWRKPGGLKAPYGFPPGDSTAAAKKVLLEFTEASASELPHLLSRLLLLPATYPSDMAQDASDLLVVLRYALAQLKLDFAQRNACDHTELALAARNALAAEDASVAAAADARYQHILVDEMQDTSNAQLNLLGQLVTDWQSGDGRSLFLVGDPQQSIYLFRQARVEKFNALLQPGACIGPVALEALELSQNFRSTPALVEWCNHTLARVFADNGSPIRFAPSTTPGPAMAVETAPITLISETDADNEAQEALDHIQALQQSEPELHIGVLARTRAQLRPLAKALRQAGVTYSGVELEALRDTPAIRNYLAIVRVLHQPEDDFASLRLVRSPAVGLSWAQCDVLVASMDAGTWAQHLRRPVPANVDSDLRNRLEILQQAVQDAENTLRSQGDLPRAARRMFHQLHLPESLNAAERRDVQRFERHLRQACDAGFLRDEDAFLRSLDGLWADTDQAAVELMTVHKSKGLEFDQVFLLGLGQSGRGGDDPLLTWHPDTGARALAIRPQSPFDPKNGKGCLYRWLRREQNDAEAAEALRLLYVAVTRARSGLHLCMTSKARSSSLGAPLKDMLGWPEPVHGSTEAAPGNDEWVSVRHPRLPTGQQTPALPGLATPSPLHAPSPSQLTTTPRALVASNDIERLEASLVGSSVHEALERLTRVGIECWQQQRDAMLQALAAGLARRGLPHARREPAIQQIQELVDRAAQGQGRQLLQAHPWHRCEYAVSGMIDGRHVQGIIDRCFETEEGSLWIVDYKTNAPPTDTSDLDSWYAELARSYGPQLNRYAQLLEALRPGAKNQRKILYLVARDELLQIHQDHHELL